MKRFLLLFILLSVQLYAAVEYNFDNKTNLPAKALKGKARYIQGVRGQAIVLGNSTLTIPAPKGLNPKEGTISFWVKPINWDSKVAEFIFFLQSINAQKNGKLIFYKYAGKAGLGTTLWFGNPKGKLFKQHCYASSRRKDEMQKGKWYFLTATWSKKNKLIRVYLNGIEIASRTCLEPMFFDKFGDFVLNPPPFRPANRNYETAFDLLKFYPKALTSQEIAKNFQEEAKVQLDISLNAITPSFVTVPVMKKAPVIDGNFEVAEWKDTAKFGGFIELREPALQIEPNTEAYVGCDKKNFYFCFVGKIPGATKLVNKQTKRDSNVFTDDAYEIYMRPPEMSMGFYQGIFNYAGTIFDTRNSDPKWNGKWKIKNGIYEGHWISEIAIPITELGSVFKENALWKFNFCRDRQQEPDIIFSSVTAAGMPFRAWFGDLRLSEKGSYGRLSLNYELLFERKLDFTLEVGNQSKQAKNTTLEIAFLDQDGKLVRKTQLKKSIPANSIHSFKFNDNLNGFRSGIVRLTAIADNKEKFFLQDVPLVFKDEVAINTQTLLDKGKLLFDVDLKTHYKTITSKNVIVQFKDCKNKVLTLKFPAQNIVKGEFKLNNMAVGDCTLRFSFLDKDGKVLLTKDVYYNHIGIPKWLTEKPGANAGVVYPYTPIKVKGNTYSVIGRTHTFGNALLPEKITSNNIDIFKNKPVLFATINKKKVFFNNFKFKTIKKADDEVILSVTANAGNLKLSGTISLEFDGFFWYNLTIDGKKTNVEELILEMEMNPKMAELYNTHFFSRENYVGKIKPPMYLRRIPSAWIGNIDVGLTMATESFQYWRNKDTTKAFKLFSRNGNLVWQVRFIDIPTVIGNKKFKYEFGIQANPVKPARKEFRSWRVHAHENANISHPSELDKKIRKYPGYNGGFVPEFKSLDAFKKEIKRFRDKGSELSLYINCILTSPDTTEYKIFREQWRNPYNVYPYCTNSNLADLQIWQLANLVKTADLKIIYVDSLGAVNCANKIHGCGYIDEKGSQQLTWPIRAVRNYMKRLYSVLHAPGHDQSKYFLWAHMSARTCAPINAFVDFQCSGEELETIISGNQNYLELYGLDEYQCYYNNSSGVMPMLLPNLGRVGSPKSRWMPKYNDQLLALTLLHDSMLWICWCDTNYIRKFYRILDNFGYKDKDLQFLSYRRQKVITSKNKNVFISIYKLKNKAMAVVVNKEKQSQKVKLDINWQKLGIKSNVAIKDVRKNKTLPSGNMIEVDIPDYNFALIQIGE